MWPLALVPSVLVPSRSPREQRFECPQGGKHCGHFAERSPLCSSQNTPDSRSKKLETYAGVRPQSTLILEVRLCGCAAVRLSGYPAVRLSGFAAARLSRPQRPGLHDWDFRRSSREFGRIRRPSRKQQRHNTSQTIT